MAKTEEDKKAEQLEAEKKRRKRRRMQRVWFALAHSYAVGQKQGA